MWGGHGIGGVDAVLPQGMEVGIVGGGEGGGRIRGLSGGLRVGEPSASEADAAVVEGHG